MFNKAQVIGRLGRDPEIRYTQDQKPIATVSLATSDFYTDKTSGQKKERIEWHRIVLFGKRAEVARDYLKKGALVLFEGPIRTRKWKDQSGQERLTTEIHAHDMKMLGSKMDSHESSTDTTEPSTSKEIPSYHQNSFDDYDEDDLPF